MMFKRKGEGIKGLLNNVKKNCTFLKGGLPLTDLVKLTCYMVVNTGR